MSPEQAGTTEKLTHAKELIQSARFGDAILWLKQLLASEPEDDDQVEALYMLAVAQRYGNQSGKALTTLGILLDKNSEYARAHQEQGHIFLSLNRSEDAAWAYTRAIELNPALQASLKALINLDERAGRNKKSQTVP